MTTTPEDLYYAPTHEWLRMEEDGVATIGITDYAQDELGDVVFVELPKTGAQVSARDEVSVVESVKTASDLYAPVAGEIIAVNERLEDSPELINSAPYGDGWIYKIKVKDEDELKQLLGSEEYIDVCARS